MSSIRRSGLRVGVDLDNTIICFDRVFHSVAVNERLIDASAPPLKNEVKRQVLASHGGTAWTRLQGIVYGPLLDQAEPYKGAAEFFVKCDQYKIPVFIISHKTRYPAIGPQHDMREAALRWLKAKQWFHSDTVGLLPKRVEFADTREEKVMAIARHECSIFIDDLPEVFAEENFPKDVHPILFDPDRHYREWARGTRATNWDQIINLLFPEGEEPDSL